MWLNNLKCAGRRKSHCLIYNIYFVAPRIPSPSAAAPPTPRPLTLATVGSNPDKTNDPIVSRFGTRNSHYCRKLDENKKSSCKFATR